MDRQQLEALLANRFPGTTQEQIAAAANAIMAMVQAAGNPAVPRKSSQKNAGIAAASPLPSTLK
jgi:hypothetical protein